MTAIPPPEQGKCPVRWAAGTDPATAQAGTQPQVALYVKKSAAGDTALTLGNDTSANSVPVTIASTQSDQSGTVPKASLYGKNSAAGDTALAVDSLGQLLIAPSKSSAYSAGKIGLVPASSATDIFTITGSASMIVRVTRIAITATTTSATPAALDVLLVKRSSANSGGTSTGSPTPVPHDSANAAVTATVLAYTANPTTGNLVGTALRNQKLLQTLATYTATDFPSKDQIIWDFKERPIVLRGTAEVLAVNLNGVSVTATASFDIDIEWTEAAS